MNRTSRNRVCTAAFFLWLAAAVGAPSAERDSPAPAFAPTASYRLGPGDVIDITVFEVEELSKPAVVSPDGSVSLPLIGQVAVAGLTTGEAAGHLRALYSKNLLRNPQITVAVREYHSQPVSVLGAVRRPGVYQLRGPRRLADVLALAEGLTPEAGREITVTRPLAEGGERSSTVASGDNPWIQAHDTVRVARAGVVYVVGEVVRPGGFPLHEPEPLTVLQALALAQGLSRTAAPQNARIIRVSAGARQEIPVRVRDLLDGRASDPPLIADDVLFIPNSRARGAMARAAEAALQVATGVIIWRR